MNRFWLVWRDGGSAPTFKHYERDGARREAERLARANPGVVFHVMAADAYVVKSDVHWSEGYVDEIPF